MNEPTCAVEVISTDEGFAALASQWEELVSRAGIPHPFLTYEWMRTWWDCFRADAALRIVVVRADSEVVAIAPLMIRRERLYGMPVRTLCLLANDHTPRCDFIIGNHSERALAAIWNFMTSYDEWDGVYLREVAQNSRTLGALTSRAEEGGLLAGVRQTGRSPIVRAAGDWNAYVRTLTSKRRTSLRSRLKRLSTLGDVTMETVTGGVQLPAAIEDAFRLEAVEWKKASRTAIVCQPEVRRFYSSLAHCAADQSWLRLQFLRVGSKRIASAYCLQYKGQIFLLKVGFDPEYSLYSPGNLLTFLAIQDVFDRGMSAYEFLGNADDWKADWTSETVPHNSVFLFARRPIPTAIHFAKFSVVPVLQQVPLYVRLRDRVFGSGA